MSKKTIYILFALILIINAVVFISSQSGKQKIYYVDLQKLYSEFELKKELEGSLLNFTNNTSQQLDSIALSLNQLKYRIDENKTERDVMMYDQLTQVYQTKQALFQQEQSNMAQQFDDQIWKQLNQYIKDYGEEHKCDFIVGGNGSGSVMYAKPSKDVTDEIIVYANAQYNGQ